jgi:arylsulfatase A-like enzyme
MMGSHGRFSKGVMYEESVQIPLIARHPDGPQGLRANALVSSVDFMPTLLDLCGLPSAPTAEGISYAPLIRGASQPEERGSVFIEYGDQRCVRRKTTKLVARRDTLDPIALYDLEADPYEQINRLDDVTYRDQQTDLHQTLKTWYQDIKRRKGRQSHTAAEPSPAFEGE